MPIAGGFGGRVKLNEQRFCSAPVCSDYCRLPKERRPRGVFLSPAIKSPKPGHDCHVCTFVAEAASVHSGGVVHGMQEGGPPVVLVLRTLERRTINAQHEHAAAWHRLGFYSVKRQGGVRIGGTPRGHSMGDTEDDSYLEGDRDIEMIGDDHEMADDVEDGDDHRSESEAKDDDAEEEDDRAEVDRDGCEIQRDEHGHPYVEGSDRIRREPE
jgi:hypothetical protein